jgi:TRAP-type C4-dicarboxylate transport system permease small subunit
MTREPSPKEGSRACNHCLEQSMKGFIRCIDTCSGIGALLSGLFLVGGWLMIMTEIIMRSGFDKTLLITDEYSGYLMCALTFCALSYTLREKGHIRMTLIQKFVRDRKRLYTDLACFLIGFGFCIAATIFAARYFYDSLVTGSQSMQISETFLAIPQFFMPLGFGLMALQFLGEILKTLLALRGDTGGLRIAKESKELGR